MMSVVMAFHNHHRTGSRHEQALEQPIGGLVTSWELLYLSPVLGRRRSDYSTFMPMLVVALPESTTKRTSLPCLTTTK